MVLCLCACGNVVQDMAGVKDCAQEDKGFSVLGVQMGSDIDCVGQILAKRVDDVFTDEVIVLHAQQVGPTIFHDIRFEFESFRGKSALEEIEMYAELVQEEARYFTYFWNKEFEQKYRRTFGKVGKEIECDIVYHIDDSTSVNVSVEKAGHGWWYRCKIQYENWGGNKVYHGIDSAQLEKYFKKAYDNRCIFKEY